MPTASRCSCGWRLIKATDRRRYEHRAFGGSRRCQDKFGERTRDSELREQFIAVLGHDLRNPLASISAGARILGREAKT